MNTSSSPRGWHSRGYLPHFDGGDVLQFITLRLADSVPLKVIRNWEAQLQYEDDYYAKEILRERIEAYIDQGYGACWLRKTEIAEIIQDSLLHFDRNHYRLFSWVIMPNHTHFILKPEKSFELSSIIQSHKNFTARMSNRLLERMGQFWQEDYFDREIRDLGDFIDKLNYIDMNPVRAGLCRNPEDWQFSSAKIGRRFRL